MDLITIDFETYYDGEYSLSKMTTEEYIRDPRFETIGVGVKVNDGETVWISGPMSGMGKYLQKHYDWKNSAVLAHNTMFDGAILYWHFGILPAVLLDTLSMARALHGVEVGGSLKALAEMYKIGVKGEEVIKAIGLRRKDFGTEALARYGDYCVNDVELTYTLFHILIKEFPRTELKVIDLLLRMFIDPVLELDIPKLQLHLQTTQEAKERLLDEVGVTREDLMSNPKFATVLRQLGVIPPMKISPATGKETFAFAKTDEEFKALQEHEDPRVQSLVSARLGTKSTLEETRTERLISIGLRQGRIAGTLPVPIKYYAAHTGRMGGMDKINLQNLPSRGPNAKMLKSCIVAPEGYTLIEADSAQIEARVLAWLAEQEDLVQAFRNKEDVYRKMAAVIYNTDEAAVTDAQRFIGKTTILGSGYGMGAAKFQAQLQTFGVELPAPECRRIIQVYRSANYEITQLWKQAQAVLMGMCQETEYSLGREGVLGVDPLKNAVVFPSGLLMRYTDLTVEQGEKGPQFQYKTRVGRVHVYGGKVVENVCQGLARLIITHQMLRIAKRYRVLLTVHDSVVCCVKDDELDIAADYVSKCMSSVPQWATGLPVAGDVQVGKNYGQCKKWTAQ